ncbi:MAG: hypothetical protein NE328_11895 [Lentisphaeraceae bacterium]|nr:hypothetical protein [Lentisphaeraceae bacterium]
MKPVKILKINEVSTPIVSDALALELMTPGRGIFAVQATESLSGIVQYYLGNNQNYEVYFTGYIEKCQQIDDKQQRITCKEFSSILAARFPVSLRHPQIVDVLNLITEKTGLEFVLEEKDWNNKYIPAVYNTGTGYSLMDFLGAELEIKKYVWMTLPDGKIYVGSWDGCPLAKAGTLEIPVSFIKELSSVGATVQIVPKLRPGILLKIGNSEPVYVTGVEPAGSFMRIKFDKSPWSTVFKRTGAA